MTLNQLNLAKLFLLIRERRNVDQSWLIVNGKAFLKIPPKHHCVVCNYYQARSATNDKILGRRTTYIVQCNANKYKNTSSEICFKGF